MAANLETPPKARNILTIKYVERSESSRFLQLPQELRDEIYRYALVEPSKWDKSHVTGCVLRNPNASGETPPFKLTAGRENIASESRDAVEPLNACLKSCVRRKGVSLLQVNKQIHQEASPVLWKNNTFCLGRSESMFEALPESVRPKIRKLSIMDVQYYGHNLVDTCTTWEIFKTLASMENLVDLEVASRALPIYHTEVLMAFRSLRYLRIVFLRPLSVKMGDNCITVYTALPHFVKMPVCNGEEHRKYRTAFLTPTFGMRTSITMRGCESCMEHFEEMVGRLEWFPYAADGRHWDDAVCGKLELRQPAQGGQVPYTVPFLGDDGVNHRVKVWGLPIDEPSVVRRRERKALIAERLSERTQGRNYTLARMISDEEQEAEPVKQSVRTARHYRHQQRLVAEENEATLRRRQEVRAMNAQHEAGRQKSAKKEAAKARLKAEKEVLDVRKAERKRSAKKVTGLE